MSPGGFLHSEWVITPLACVTDSSVAAAWQQLLLLIVWLRELAPYMRFISGVGGPPCFQLMAFRSLSSQRWLSHLAWSCRLMCSHTSERAWGLHRTGSCVPLCPDEACEQTLRMDGALRGSGWAGSGPSSADGFVDDLEQSMCFPGSFLFSVVERIGQALRSALEKV